MSKFASPGAHRFHFPISQVCSSFCCFCCPEIHLMFVVSVLKRHSWSGPSFPPAPSALRRQGSCQDFVLRPRILDLLGFVLAMCHSVFLSVVAGLPLKDFVVCSCSFFFLDLSSLWPCPTRSVFDFTCLFASIVDRFFVCSCRCQGYVQSWLRLPCSSVCPIPASSSITSSFHFCVILLFHSRRSSRYCF
jgi:hypothetical protein